MPRPLRLEYPGAWYHVMNRGINRMKIFFNDTHREIFLSLLEEIHILFSINIHSYCLMDNHYHLLLETPHANLSKAMRHLNGIYTQRINRLEQRDGPIFRGRYKAILIESDNYLLKVSRYIHLNPIEAKMVKDLSQYLWSSYRYYINLPAPYWLSTDHILSYFDHAIYYREFISEGVDVETKDFYDSSPISPILGNKKFANDNIKNLDEKYKISTSSDVNRATKTYCIEKICYLVAEYYDIEINTLKCTYKNNFPRMLSIYLARNLTQLTHHKISDFFTGIKRASISTLIIKCKKLLENDSQIKNDYINILDKIQNES